MASIERKQTKKDETRYVVRWRMHGRSKERSFRRRSDAEAWKRKMEGDDLAGVLVDPRAGDQHLQPYADEWLRTRLVRGRPLSLMTVQGYRASCDATSTRPSAMLGYETSAQRRSAHGLRR